VETFEPSHLETRFASSSPPPILSQSRPEDRCMVSVDAARAKSEEEWLQDLARLRTEAKERFGDVAWVAEGSQRLVYAHKCIVYARATGEWHSQSCSCSGVADCTPPMLIHLRELATKVYGRPAQFERVGGIFFRSLDYLSKNVDPSIARSTRLECDSELRRHFSLLSRTLRSLAYV
jgi:hypothetical protein